MLSLLQSVKPTPSNVDFVLSTPAATGEDNVLTTVPFPILAIRQWVRIFPKSLIESLAVILVDGKKQIEQSRSAGGDEERPCAATPALSRLDNVLGNLVLWRSLITRFGGKDPILGNEGIRQALLPLLSQESFFAKHQRLLLALAAKSKTQVAE